MTIGEQIMEQAYNDLKPALVAAVEEGDEERTRRIILDLMYIASSIDKALGDG